MLRTPHALVRWGQRLELVGRCAADDEELAAALELRHALYRAFAAIAEGEAPRPADLEHLRAAHAEAVAAGRPSAQQLVVPLPGAFDSYVLLPTLAKRLIAPNPQPRSAISRPGSSRAPTGGSTRSIRRRARCGTRFELVSSVRSPASSSIASPRPGSAR